jgi:hypothetical protein
MHDVSIARAPVAIQAPGTIDRMAEAATGQTLDQQLQEMGVQLAWVRDYL